MLALSERQQSFFVGIRSTFYRIATVVGQGVLVILAGYIESRNGVTKAWMAVMGILSVFFLAVSVYHGFILPRPASDHPAPGVTLRNVMGEFCATFVSFFRKPQAFVAIAFMLLYRLPEAQLLKLIYPFLLDSRETGGLGLSTSEVGVVYGTVGVIGLTIGGIIGGILASRGGLKRWMWPMAWSLSLTCGTFCYLALVQPSDLLTVNVCVFVEQFGYGFGFTAYMLYLIYFSEGAFKTAHYAICTGFMALGMMLPGMAAGWIQEQLGYVGFFWWVMGCCLVTIAVTACVKVPASFGCRS